jgi:IS30 family transposase
MSHLTHKERCQIDVLKQEGFGVRSIGRALKRNASVISRELRRNATVGGGYAAQSAQPKAEERREFQRGPRKQTPGVMQTIRAGLDAGWSPEQISGREALEKRGFVSHQWIYEAIERDRSEGGQLYKQLCRKYRKGGARSCGKQAGRNRIPGRVPIGERPAVVEKRSRYGDWESDLIEGRGGGYLVTCVERTSRFTVLSRVPSKQADVVAAAEAKMLAAFKVLTITRDNGMEFARHGWVNEALGSRSYFCEPYHSWERGLVENRNGLVRRQLPKGCSFEGVGRTWLNEIEDEMNAMPHKVLGWRSPVDLIDKILLN